MKVPVKAKYSVIVLLVAVALLVINVPVRAAASETDDRIEASAKKSYVFQTYLKDDVIQVKSSDGVVTLTGTVVEEPHVKLAQETVASLPGVKSVDNLLQFKGEPAAANSDPWVTMKVKASLLFHRNLSSGKTDVQVKDGIVTLRGEAASTAQMDLATEYVKDVEGVKDVKNEMTVAKTKASSSQGETMGESIDDASITAQVRMTLLYHRSTSVLRTTVETNGGVVTVGGVAKMQPKRIWSASS